MLLKTLLTLYFSLKLCLACVKMPVHGRKASSKPVQNLFDFLNVSYPYCHLYKLNGTHCELVKVNITAMLHDDILWLKFGRIPDPPSFKVNRTRFLQVDNTFLIDYEIIDDPYDNNGNEISVMFDATTGKVFAEFNFFRPNLYRYLIRSFRGHIVTLVVIKDGHSISYPQIQRKVKPQGQGTL